MSNHPELYVECYTKDGASPFIMIHCQCGYQDWYEGRKFTILDIDSYGDKFKDHWQKDCLKTKGELYV